MNHDIRLQKNQYKPGQELAARVAVLEHRLVLNSTFKFPHFLVGATPGQTGNLMMTSHTYERAQREVDKAFANFAGSMAKIKKQFGPDYLANPLALNLIGIGELGVTHHSALGRLDTALIKAESRLPYGKGLAIDPSTGLNIGLGLSRRTAPTSPNSALAVIAEDPDFTGANSSAVVDLLEAGLINIAHGESTKNEAQMIHSLRAQTLQFAEIAPGVLGTLPNYLAQFGSTSGTRSFSTKNT
jgi:hypothetical protein